MDRVKHPDLFEAAKRVGSQKALADFLGQHQTVVGRWVNLQDYPKSVLKVEGFEQKLLLVTGKLVEDLWPQELKDKIDGRPSEVLRLIPLRNIDLIGLLVPDALVMGEERQSEIRDCIDVGLRSLTYREREVVKLRWGLCESKSLTLAECGAIFRVNAERIRQIESKALRKLYSRLREFECFSDLLI